MKRDDYRDEGNANPEEREMSAEKGGQEEEEEAAATNLIAKLSAQNRGNNSALFLSCCFET